MIIRFQHEIDNKIPEEMQLQMAKKLVESNVGLRVEIFDPRIEEGDRMILIAMPVLSYQNMSDSGVAYVSEVVSGIMKNLEENGPLEGLT